MSTHTFFIEKSNIDTNTHLNWSTVFLPRYEKTVFGVSDQVRHKPGCTATEDGKRLESLDLGRREIVLSV